MPPPRPRVPTLDDFYQAMYEDAARKAQAAYLASQRAPAVAAEAIGRGVSAVPAAGRAAMGAASRAASAVREAEKAGQFLPGALKQGGPRERGGEDIYGRPIQAIEVPQGIDISKRAVSVAERNVPSGMTGANPYQAPLPGQGRDVDVASLQRPQGRTIGSSGRTSSGSTAWDQEAVNRDLAIEASLGQGGAPKTQPAP